MNRSFVLAAAVLAILAPAVVPASTWTLDPDHTGVHFTVRHLMVSNVKGQFEKVSGVARFDEKDISGSSVEVTIDAASINTRVVKRDTHLMSHEFLHVEKFPTITFRSTKVEKAGDGKYKVTGDLTIHGVTRSVVLDVEGVTPPVKDPWGKTRIGATATTTINRKDYGLNWNQVLETGGVLVGDEVAITIDVEVIRKEG